MLRILFKKNLYDYQVYKPNNFGNPVLCQGILKRDTVSFGYSLFLKKIPNLHCAYCRRKVFTTEEIYRFKTRVPGYKGQTAIRAISERSAELKGTEKRVAELLISLAKTYPHKTVAEIIKDMVTEYERRLLDEQVDILKRILEQAEKLPPKKCRQIQRLIPYTDRKKLLKLSIETRQEKLKRKTIIENLMNLKEVSANPETESIYSYMIQLAKRLPKAKNNYYAFIVKYGNRSPEEFLEHMIMPLQASADHIYLHKDVKSNEQHNLINSCRECNWRRGDMPFKEWMKQSPERYPNFLRYLDEIHFLEDNPRVFEKFSKILTTYPRKLIRTITKLLNGAKYNDNTPLKAQSWYNFPE